MNFYIKQNCLAYVLLRLIAILLLECNIETVSKYRVNSNNFLMINVKK